MINPPGVLFFFYGLLNKNHLINSKYYTKLCIILLEILSMEQCRNKNSAEGIFWGNNGIVEPFCEQSEQNVSRAGLSEGQWERVTLSRRDAFGRILE